MSKVLKEDSITFLERVPTNEDVFETLGGYLILELTEMDIPVRDDARVIPDLDSSGATVGAHVFVGASLYQVVRIKEDFDDEAELPVWWVRIEEV